MKLDYFAKIQSCQYNAIQKYVSLEKSKKKLSYAILKCSKLKIIENNNRKGEEPKNRSLEFIFHTLTQKEQLGFGTITKFLLLKRITNT